MGNEHIKRIKSALNQVGDDYKCAVQERIDQVGQMKDLVDVIKALFEISLAIAQLEAEVFKLKQQIAVAQEFKSILYYLVRHEFRVREREQERLTAYLVKKIQKDLKDPKIQQQILDQAVVNE